MTSSTRADAVEATTSEATTSETMTSEGAPALATSTEAGASPPVADEAPPEVMLDLHRRMVRIRVFEETAGKLAEAARLPGFLDLYVGQEAVAAGVCAALRDTDQITSTHRDTATSSPREATSAG